MKTMKKTIEEVELTQEDLITAIKNYVEPKVPMTGLVTITCKTENGGLMNILPMNKEDGEEIITYIEIRSSDKVNLEILKSDKPNTSPIV